MNTKKTTNGTNEHESSKQKSKLIRINSRRTEGTHSLTLLFKPFFTFKKKAPLPSYILGRFLIMAVMLFLLGFAIFGLMALAPGDIVSQVMIQQIMSSSEGRAVTAQRDFAGEWAAAQRKELGLDQPFYVQYFKWLKQVVINHDLGVSLISRAPVAFLIGSRLFNSVLLNIISLVLITFFSFLLGVYFSTKAGTKVDLAVTFFALALHAFPGILLLILLQLFMKEGKLKYYIKRVAEIITKVSLAIF